MRVLEYQRGNNALPPRASVYEDLGDLTKLFSRKGLKKIKVPKYNESAKMKLIANEGGKSQTMVQDVR